MSEEQEEESFTIRISKLLNGEIESLADKEHRSKNSQIIVLLEKGLKVSKAIKG